MKQIQAQAVVIGLSTNGLANVRALAQHGVSVIIFLSREQSEEIYAATRYGKPYLVEVSDGKEILRHLQNLPEETRYILYPTGDSHVSYLSMHRDELPANCMLAFPEDRIIQMLLNKELFESFCQSYQFPLPTSKLIRHHDDLQWCCEQMTFPLIAKTVMKLYKQSLDKAYILSDKDELHSWYASIQAIQPEFLLQEYIPGTDHDVFFTMQYISSTGKLLASFTGRKIRQWPPLRGGTASAEPSDNEFLTKLTYDFFKKAGFFGIGSMEYKRDSRTGKFYMIEPTVGRTDFQEGVAIANGVNIPLIAYQDIMGDAVHPVFQKKNTHKIWMHVLNDRLARNWYISQKQLTYLQWLISLRHVRSFDAFSLCDPGPILWLCREKLISQVRKFFKK